ncbi:MAG: GNAT family N-acetyltransferase, partial [Pirellulales bacterium]
MPVQNLDKLFHPQRIAVIGASNRPASVGRTVLSNLIEGGFSGPIFPVNPKRKTLQGLATYPNVGTLPEVPDMAVVCIPGSKVPQIVRECGEAGILGLVILSAGFRETGEEGKALEEAVRKEAAAFDGLRIIGPNCLGIIAPHANLNASFAASTPAKGRVAFISQSGAICTSVLDWAREEGIGFSHFVSIGNVLDVGFGDLIDYFAMDQWTESILLYMESVAKPREFMSAARAFARQKPLIAYKAGRFAASAEAAASHTGAMAGVDSVYEAAMNRAGIVRIFEMGDMFDCAELLSKQKTPSGRRLGIVTNAGGPGVMATDALLSRNGALAEPSNETLDKLDQKMPSAWSHGNPFDVLGDATPERYAEALEIVLADRGVDAVLVIFTPQAMSSPTESAKAVIEVARKSRKPILVSWMGGPSVREGNHLFNQAQIPTYNTPEQAIRAFMYLVSYSRNREVLYETPRNIPMKFSLDRGKLRSVFDTILSSGRDLLSESMSKALLEAYEIPITKPFAAHSVDDAVRLANRVGYPVAMKLMSPQITHKTDVGGVKLDLADDRAVSVAYEQIVASAQERRPDAQIEGVTIQKMVTDPVSYELIVGAKRDPIFGAVMLVGAGGITTELYQDRALELPPLNERLARRMLESLKSWPLLTGYRGKPGVNVDRLIEILMRFSYLVADYPEIKELDVNPLLVTREDAIALDARIVLDHGALPEPPRPYSHLAIRPYPDEYTKETRLKDGTHVLLRPIKPEDEPLWRDMLDNCSQESIWFRFRYLFKQATHEMATRFCFIDYDREIAIVAEIEEEGQRKLIGVGRLVADADHTDAEFAVLVVDAYQKRGLGAGLTDYCLEICRDWGIHLVVAETAPDNQRVLELFRHRG